LKEIPFQKFGAIHFIDFKACRSVGGSTFRELQTYGCMWLIIPENKRAQKKKTCPRKQNKESNIVFFLVPFAFLGKKTPK